MEEFRVIIAGTRDFSNYELLKEKCDNILSTKRQDSNIVIVSGTAKGADRLGERYASERGFLLRRFPADWDKDGNKAGPIRNAKMADNADALIAFWDGTSRGTAHMIRMAKEKGLATRVINYKTAIKMNENKKIEQLQQETADNAIKYIKTGTGIDCLRDSFNELCKAMGIPTPQAPDNYEREDIINALKEEPWVKDIAAKPADQRTLEDIDRIVNDFYCEHWLMKPEEVTSKDVAQLMDFADPNSHRHIAAQRVAIDCIHALNHEQLQQLDKALDAVVVNKTVHEIEDKDEHFEDPKYQAAMQAIVDRVMDYGAKFFTPEQIDTLERVVADCENETQREHTYERLWTETEPRLTDAMKEWKDDAHEELRDLAHGIARSEKQGLKI